MKRRAFLLAYSIPPLFAAAFLSVVPKGFGQANPGGDQNETIELSPFEVLSSTDKGYIATRASGATKTNTAMIELPHSIQVLNSEFIADTGSTNVFQAARYVSNVAGGSQRGDDAILIRGFGATRLRNGQPYATGNAFTFDEMAAFDRVEVIKGASAVLYGSSAPGGLINLVDKRPLSKQQASLSLTAGSNSFYKGVLDVTGPVTKVGNTEINYRAIASYEDSESWRWFVFRERKYFNASLEAKFNKDTSVLTRVEYQKDNLLDSYGKPYNWFNASNQETLLNLPDGFFRGDPGVDKKRVERFNWETTLQHHFNENWIARASVGYGDAYGARTEVFISAQSTTMNLFPRFAQYIPDDQQQWVGEVNLLGKVKTGPVTHQLLAGVNFVRRDNPAGNFRYAVSPDPFDVYAPVYGNTVLGAEVTGVRRDTVTNTDWDGYFVQDQFGVLNDRVQFILGFRKDKLKQKIYSAVTKVTTLNNDDQVSPRYGVLWRITPELSFYGSYNESFTPASGAGSVQGIPFPSPTAEQTEAGFKFELFNKRLFGGVAVFENIRRNQTTTDVLNPGFSVATGEITSKGSELDLGFSITSNWQIIAGVGFTKAQITEDTVAANVGLEQPNVPNQMASLWTKYDFMGDSVKGLSIGLGINYVGVRAGQRDNVARSYGVPSYTVANAMISYRRGDNKFSLNIENLTDKHYVMTAQSRLTDPGDHRSIRFTYTWSF